MTSRILIVEDDAIVARDLQSSLSKLGYVITGVAPSGARALAMAGRDRPDVVLMDIMFDGDIDGIETAQRLRDQHDLPVIYLTAYGDQATFERARHTLPLAYVLKPFDALELGLTIETALQRRRLETALAIAESRFVALSSAVRDGVVATDADGNITFVNGVTESLTGYRASELVGTDWTQILFPIEDPPLRPAPSRAAARARAPQPAGKWAELLAKDGNKKLVSYDSVPAADRRGNVKGVIFAFRS